MELHRTKLGGAVALVAACALVVPASAANKTVTYAGKTAAGSDVGLDVAVKKGRVTQIINVRAIHVLLHCDQSGDVPTGNIRLPLLNVKVNKHGKFNLTYTEPNSPNTSTFTGKFKGKTVSGSFVYAHHFPADDQYPEENCHTDQISFDATRGAPDATAGA
jgi:hypothetical protein